MRPPFSPKGAKKGQKGGEKEERIGQKGGKRILKLGVGGEGQDTSRNFEGNFGTIHAILPMLGIGAKTEAKTEI